jgi:hypothetical protein
MAILMACVFTASGKLLLPFTAKGSHRRVISTVLEELADIAINSDVNIGRSVWESNKQTLRLRQKSRLHQKLSGMQDLKLRISLFKHMKISCEPGGYNDYLR